MCLWVCTMYLALKYDIKNFLDLNLLCASSIQMSSSSLMNSIELEPYSMRPFPSGFFHLALCLAGFLLPLSHECPLLTMSFLCLGKPLLLIAEYYSTKWMNCSSVSPFPRRASCLPPVLYNYEQSCYKHSYAGFLGGHKFSTQLGKH